MKTLHIPSLMSGPRAIDSTRSTLRLGLLTVVSVLAACGGGGGGGGSSGGGNNNTTFTVGGTVTGLTGSGLVLQNNGTDNLSVSASGAFAFATSLANGSTYEVTVLTQPSGPTQTCTVANGTGNVADNNVVNAAVTCVDGGTVGGEGQVAPDLTGTTVTMTDEDRDAGILKVDAAWEQFSHGDLDADNAGFAAYIRTLPEFADAGVTPDRTVWARFKDRAPMSWVGFRRNQLRSPTIASSLLSENHSNIAKGNGAIKAMPLAFDIPQKGIAMLVDVNGLARNSTAREFPWLTNAGYSPQSSGGSIHDFMTRIKDVDVLHIATHGFMMVDTSGRARYVLSTSNTLTVPKPAQWSFEEQLYENMTKSGELARASYQPENGPPVHFRVMTEAFIQKYWTFKQHSLIFIDACSLFDISKLEFAFAGTSFRRQLQAISGNATTVMGWSKEVEVGFAADTAGFFFDRILGENSFNPESPPQRAFPYADVLAWMVRTGKDTDPNWGAKLKLEVLNSPSGQLRPTISGFNITHPGAGATDFGLSPTRWILEIYGNFGPDPGGEGKVTVNGFSLNVIPNQWTEQRILAEYPPTGPGNTGDLVVTVRNHESNSAPITQWMGTIKQTVLNYGDLGPGAQMDASCTVLGAGAVGAFRNEPAGALGRGGAFALRVAGPCNYTLSGTWTVGDEEHKLTGGGELSPIDDVDKISGSMRSLNRSPDLPATWITNFGLKNGGVAQGTHTIKNLQTGSITTEPVIGNWLPVGFTPSGSVKLGTDYSFSGSLKWDSFDNEQSTETWNLVPVNTPTTSTKS